MMQSTWILDAVRDDAGLGDPLDALTVAGVDQLDVRPVEGRQIVVVEGRPLAELAIPGLQRLGGGRIGDGFVDARADAVHLLKVGDFHEHRRLALREFGCAVGLLRRDAEVAEDVGPAVVDEVLFDRNADDHVVEVLAPLALPAGLQASWPIRDRWVCCRAHRPTTACAGRHRAAWRARRRTARTGSRSRRCR